MRILGDIIYFFLVVILSFRVISLSEIKRGLESEKENLQRELRYYQEENARLERLNLERLNQQTMYLLLNGFEED